MNMLIIILLQVFAAALCAITFLQSGIDKLMDYKGNKEWLTGYFEKSPLRGMVPGLLPILTAFEMSAGIMSGLGLVMILINGHSEFAVYGSALSVSSVLMLFFGQRMAKDYAAAGSMTGYFIAFILCLIILSYSEYIMFAFERAPKMGIG